MSHHRPLRGWLCSQHKLNHTCHWLCSQAGLATSCKLFSLWWATEQHCLISTMLPSPCHRYRTICSLQGLPNYQFSTRLTDYIFSFPHMQTMKNWRYKHDCVSHMTRNTRISPVFADCKQLNRSQVFRAVFDQFAYCKQSKTGGRKACNILVSDGKTIA